MTRDGSPHRLRSQRRMRGDRAAAAFLLALATAAGTGCSATPASEGPAGGGDDLVDPTEVDTEGEDTEGEDTEGKDTEGKDTEEGGPPPEEETGTAEEPAEGGGDRVSIELAGLPVGGGEVLDVDGTWCQVLFWGSVPAGVWLEIDSVQVGDPGGTLLDSGCDGAPPCAGVTISADEPGGCAVMIRPPSPDIEFVEVRLDGTLSCPDQASCDAIGATDGSWTRITNPTGGGVPGEETSTDPDVSTADDEPSTDGDDDLATTGTG